MNTRLMTSLILLHSWLTGTTRRDERGAFTVEQAVLTAGVVGLATIVIAILTSFVQAKLGALG